MEEKEEEGGGRRMWLYGEAEGALLFWSCFEGSTIAIHSTQWSVFQASFSLFVISLHSSGWYTREQACGGSRDIFHCILYSLSQSL